ncbi:MAG: ATPase [Proteobacteria bacterium]|nr:ATPase [Pseudomonadota bacterium]
MTQLLADEELNFVKSTVSKIKNNIAQVVVGQEEMIDCLLIGVFSKGHVLLEGAPGLAKTLTVRVLSQSLDLPFQRIQFTPDLLPADLVGTEIYSPKTGEFSTRKGPIFTNIMLADEINRAPPKVQSALLEAMAEHQVTIGGVTYPLPSPFLVLATQNPLEQEGTYPLPEAQADRFMLKVLIDYPTEVDERGILLGSVSRESKENNLQSVVGPQELTRIQMAMDEVHVEELILDYILSIVRTTREADKATSGLSKYIDFGASPRASLSLLAASKAKALLKGRSYVTPDDVKSVCPAVLRHRILLSYEAEAEGIDADWVIDKMLSRLKTP